MSASRANQAASVLLVLVGCLSMTGHILGVDLLKGIGALTCASPAPKVFSAVRGLETYSTKFYLRWRDHEGQPHKLYISPQVYARLQGPYNRRNIYGAVLAFGPILSTDSKTQAMHRAVMRYAACGERPLFKELGIDPQQVAGDIQVILEPLPGTDLKDLPKVLKVSCP